MNFKIDHTNLKVDEYVRLRNIKVNNSGIYLLIFMVCPCGVASGCFRIFLRDNPDDEFGSPSLHIGQRTYGIIPLADGWDGQYEHTTIVELDSEKTYAVDFENKGDKATSETYGSVFAVRLICLKR